MIEVPVADVLEVRVGKLLRERAMKLALAESCTGGLISSRLTDVPGSSEYFMGSVISYAYDAKVDLLGVSWDTLKAHGAVSRETVIEMARGAREALHTDIAVSVSGIAGPGGGTDEKPVGTTWIGLAATGGEWARRFQFSGDRSQIKKHAADAALEFLLDFLNGRLNNGST